MYMYICMYVCTCIYMCVCAYTHVTTFVRLSEFTSRLCYLLTVPSWAGFITSLYLSFFKCKMEKIVSIS